MYLAIDCECSYNPDKIGHPWNPEAFLSTIAIYTSDGDRICWAFRHDEADPFYTDKAKVKDIQSWIDRANKIIGHNLQYDYNWLEFIGVKLDHKKLWDTMIVEYLLSGQTVTMPSLDSLAEKYVGEAKLDVVKTEYWEKGINTDKVPLAILEAYNIKDCELTLKVAQAQAPLVQQAKMEKLVELKGEETKCVAEIERHGLALDDSVRGELEKSYGGLLTSIVNRIQEIAGRRINVDSPEQLSAFLFGGSYSVAARCYYIRILKGGRQTLCSRRDKLKKKISGLGFTPIGEPGKKGDQYSTSKDVLVQLQKQAKNPIQKEVIELLLERSSMATMMKTFIVGVADKVVDGVVHCDLNQTITRTGRFSSSNPNLQNIPRGNTSPVKSMYVPQYDCFVAGDAAQIEWRVAAYLSRDKVMMEEIRANVDQHAETRRDIFQDKVDRVLAKIFNFRMIFLGSGYAFYMDPEMPAFSLKRWEQIVDAFWNKYSGLYEYHQKNIKEVYRTGQLRSVTGRIFPFKKYETKQGLAYNKSQIANTPIQSLAAGDLIPLAMNRNRKELNHLEKTVMCNQVHDDIMYDTVQENVGVVCETMIDTFRQLPTLFNQHFGVPFDVPLDGECKWGKNWRDMEKWKI